MMTLGENIHKLRFSSKWPTIAERLEKRSEAEEIVKQSIELYAPREIDHPPINEYLRKLGQHEAIRYIWFCELFKRKYETKFEFTLKMRFVEAGPRVDIFAWNDIEIIIIEIINNNWSEKNPRVFFEKVWHPDTILDSYWDEDLRRRIKIPYFLSERKIKFVLALTPDCAKKQKGNFSYSLFEKAKRMGAFVWTPDQSLFRIFCQEKPKKPEYKPRFYSHMRRDDISRMLET